MIGDLLAQITGEGGPSAARPPPVQPPKRKAADDLRRTAAVKAPRTSAAEHTTVRTAPASSAPLRQSLDVRAKSAAASAAAPRTARTAPRPNNGSSASTASARPATAAATSSRPPSTLNHNGTAVSSTTAPKAAPKKGSYLEIMERAKAAQAALGQVGKIQHKPLEKGPSKRERLAAQAEKGVRPGRPAAASVASGRSGMSRPLPGSREARTRGRPPPVPTAAAKPEANGRKKTAGEERVKKAAVATTGYQGTARPRPATTHAGPSRAGTTDTARGTDQRAASRSRLPFGGPRRSRYDEEDDDMDDFIEYDEDEDEPDVRAPRYRQVGGQQDDYYDEDESDMEAGISDIDEEEQLAERVARREDAQQEALERKLKAEKEQRKRQAMRR